MLILGRAASSQEFIEFKRYAAVRKFPKLVLNRIISMGKMTRSQAVQVAVRITMEFIMLLGATYG
jgi:hypothetical protein